MCRAGLSASAELLVCFALLVTVGSQQQWHRKVEPAILMAFFPNVLYFIF